MPARLLLLLLSLLIVPAWASGQVVRGQGQRSERPRRMWPRDRLAVRPISAIAGVTPPAGRRAAGRRTAGKGPTRLKQGDNLRWRRRDERSERLAQVPNVEPFSSQPSPPPSYVPGDSGGQPYTPQFQETQPYAPPNNTGGQLYTPQGAGGPSNARTVPPPSMTPGAAGGYPMGPPTSGFSEAGPPAWAAPGYWQPNGMMPGEPDCPPYLTSPYDYGNGYGYGDPDCPPYMLPPYMMQPPITPAPVPGPFPAVPAQTESRYSNVPLLPPNIIGSLMGTQPQLLKMSFEHAFHTRGTIVSGAPGSPGAVLAYERNGGFPNDFNSIPGTARDVSGDGFTDTFNMTEPLPPNEVPTSPGPGYTYDGGTVAYTNTQSETTAQDGVFQDNQLWYAEYSFSKTLEIPAAGALSVRRMYVAQNNSPIPRDRVFLDFRNFRKARPNLGDVSWYTFGLEKTFNSQRGSIETRLPFANTLDNEVFEDEPSTKSTDFGNISFTLKHIFWGNERWLFSGGAGLSLPTGPETRVFLSDGTEVLVVDNDSVHVQPFVAMLWLPEENFFVESFISVDYDTRGNNVRGNINGGRLPTIGEYRSASVLIGDVAAGYWIYTNPSFRAAMQGIALVAELSYQTTLESRDAVSGNGLTLAGTPQNIDTFGATLGAHAYLFNSLSLSGGFGLPVTSGDKSEYDVSAIFMANWHF